MKPWNPTNEQLLCRDLQHTWEPATARREKKCYVRTLRCGRCGTVKEQVLDQDGYILKSMMTYPDGYIRPGEGRFTKDDRAILRVRNIEVPR